MDTMSQRELANIINSGIWKGEPQLLRKIESLLKQFLLTWDPKIKIVSQEFWDAVGELNSVKAAKGKSEWETDHTSKIEASTEQISTPEAETNPAKKSRIENVEEAGSGTKSQGATHKCVHCDRVFKHRKNMLYHIRCKHGNGQNRDTVNLLKSVESVVGSANKENNYACGSGIPPDKLSKYRKNVLRYEEQKRRETATVEQANSEFLSSAENEVNNKTEVLGAGFSSVTKLYKRDDPVSPPNAEDEMFSSMSLPEIEIYQKYWHYIRTHKRIHGKMIKLFNYRLLTLNNSEIKEYLMDAFRKQQCSCKINFGLGFILRNTITSELVYFYASANTSCMSQPAAVTSIGDMEQIFSHIDSTDLLECAFRQRPTTKYVVQRITNLTVHVTQLNKYTLVGKGIFVPEYIRKKRSLYSLDAHEKTGTPLEDNLCFFRCLALAFGSKVTSLENKTKQFLSQWCKSEKIQRAEFGGMHIQDLGKAEALFKVNVVVFELLPLTREPTGKAMRSDVECEDVARLLRRSFGKHKSTMYLNLYKDHFSYIRDVNAYASCFKCKNCGRLNRKRWKLWQHELKCDAKTKYIFPFSGYGNGKTIMQKIESIIPVSIPEDLRFRRYYAVFDFEAMMVQPKQKCKASNAKLQLTKEQIPVSVSVSSNVPGHSKISGEPFEQPFCLVREDPDVLVKDMHMYLREISRAARKLMHTEYREIFDGLRSYLRNLMENLKRAKRRKARHPGHKKFANLARRLKSKFRYCKLEYKRIWISFNLWVDTLPVMGFNSAFYDLSLIRRYYLPYLLKNRKQVKLICRNSSYLLLLTESLRFLDISLFLPAGTSYSSWLQMFETKEQKLSFCYDYLDSFERLSETELPAKKHFYSSLKNHHISDDMYNILKTMWEKNNWKTLKDLLVCYNNADVGPFKSALDKTVQYWRKQGLCLFSDGITLPSLAKRRMFTGLPPNITFPLINKKTNHLYEKIRKNTVGGPSIIFCRYAKVDETRIRSGPYLCKNILAYDASSLYLYCLGLSMPTNNFAEWKPSTTLLLSDSNFDTVFYRDFAYPFRNKEMGFLAWYSKTLGYEIESLWNGQEKCLRYRKKIYRIDGFCEKLGVCLSFHGCYFHEHDFSECSLRNKSDRSMKDILKIQKRTAMLNFVITKAYGYRHLVMYECIWDKIVHDNGELQCFINDYFTLPMKTPRITGGQLLEAVRSGEFFGMCTVDIITPEHLKEHFRELTPIFKKVTVSRKDLSSRMLEYAEQYGLMSRPSELLINSYFGKEIMLTTPLLQFYMTHGLQVTKIYHAVEAKGQRCFQHLVDDIAANRRAADERKVPKSIAELEKICGNSFFGTTSTRIENHKNIHIVDEDDASDYVNSAFFDSANQVTEDTIEVHMRKRKIVYRLPTMIGFFIFNYAKLHMLKFYYEFIDRYFDRDRFMLLEMDTDCYMMGIAGQSLDDIVKEDRKIEYFSGGKQKWIACDTHSQRTPGIFKLEYGNGTEFAGLCSKTYLAIDETDEKNFQISHKGISKRLNKFTMEQFKSVLFDNQRLSGENRGMMRRDGKMFLYTQDKFGLTGLYAKRLTLADNIHTDPLDL